jgi:hypothetical protein
VRTKSVVLAQYESLRSVKSKTFHVRKERLQTFFRSLDIDE